VPSEKTWAAPPTTLMAVSSSMAYVGAGIRAAHLSAGLSLFNDFIRQFMDFAGLRNRGQAQVNVVDLSKLLIKRNADRGDERHWTAATAVPLP
jgi:hypothetical protein